MIKKSLGSLIKICYLNCAKHTLSVNKLLTKKKKPNLTCQSFYYAHHRPLSFSNVHLGFIFKQFFLAYLIFVNCLSQNNWLSYLYFKAETHSSFINNINQFTSLWNNVLILFHQSFNIKKAIKMVMSRIALCSVLVKLLARGGWVDKKKKCSLWPSRITILSPIAPGLHL